MDLIERIFREFCEKNDITVTLSYEMPEGYETAFGTYDVTVNTLFFNRKVLQGASEYEALFYLYHELRHALQYLKPTAFDAKIQESRFYVILYNGVCYKLVNQVWKECTLDGDFCNAYLSLPYEIDANQFAYQQVVKWCGGSTALQTLYQSWLPEKAVDHHELQRVFCRIDDAIKGA